MEAKALAMTLAFAVLGGCSWEFNESPAPLVGESIKVAFIGNSIVRHGPAPAIGWSGDWGMAASTIDNDYVHKTAAAMGLDKDNLHIRNLYPFETNGTAAKRLADSLVEVFNKSETIVIHLGENVPIYNPIKLYEFNENYDYLLSKVPSGKQIYCMSTFWKSSFKDYLIKRTCENHGGTFVFIGDVYESSENVDRHSTEFKDRGVNKHPHDFGMSAIAQILSQQMALTSAD